MRRTPPDGVSVSGLRFREDLGFDSLDRLEFIARVEQRFRLPLGDDEVEGLVTVGEVARLVADRVSSPTEKAVGGATQDR